MMHERGRENHLPSACRSAFAAPLMRVPATIEMQVAGVILQLSGFPKIAIAAN
jgi:hypothetical protein